MSQNRSAQQCWSTHLSHNVCSEVHGSIHCSHAGTLVSPLLSSCKNSCSTVSSNNSNTCTHNSACQNDTLVVSGAAISVICTDSSTADKPADDETSIAPARVQQSMYVRTTPPMSIYTSCNQTNRCTTQSIDTKNSAFQNDRLWESGAEIYGICTDSSTADKPADDETSIAPARVQQSMYVRTTQPMSIYTSCNQTNRCTTQSIDAENSMQRVPTQLLLTAKRQLLRPRTDS